MSKHALENRNNCFERCTCVSPFDVRWEYETVLPTVATRHDFNEAAIYGADADLYTPFVVAVEGTTPILFYRVSGLNADRKWVQGETIA